MDARYHPEETRAWLDSDDDELDWVRMLEHGEKEAPEGFRKHVAEFRECFQGNVELGQPPGDLYDVISLIALAGPATVALRGLRRQTSEATPAAPVHLMAGAARTALGFRTLFNLHDVRSMIRPTGRDESRPYWRLVLKHCAGGNLQAVADEYFHVLRESLGLIDAGPARMAYEVSREVADVLAIVGAPLELDQFSWGPRRGLRKHGNLSIRCRYALMFGNIRSEDGSGARRKDVRQAFNSPFRPFVLATTSIGQEGLDFHLYCPASVIGICHQIRLISNSGRVASTGINATPSAAVSLGTSDFRASVPPTATHGPIYSLPPSANREAMILSPGGFMTARNP